jgi:hypothetical protein
MPLPDLTEDEHAELVRLVRDAIAADRYFLAPRVKRLKSILEKPEPAPAVTPYPPPRPTAEPSAGAERRERREDRWQHLGWLIMRALGVGMSSEHCAPR